MTFTLKQIDAAVSHLRRNDSVMRLVIRRVGPFTLKPRRDRFGTLVRSIISKQISTHAARSIRTKLEALVPGRRFTAEKLVALPIDELRSAGLSGQKVRYILDLSHRVLGGELPLGTIGRLSDEAAIEQLVEVKGIGRWTAQMFLIFSLGRLDVFPHDDLGIRTALRNLYDLDDLPDKAAAHAVAELWRPYATVASWYCWRSGDL